jgi:hypothetical protein
MRQPGPGCGENLQRGVRGAEVDPLRGRGGVHRPEHTKTAAPLRLAPRLRRQN